MFRKKSTDTGSNFWISYADLMAGLLFVFILFIGAIISKTIILKSTLHEREGRLAKVSSALKEKESTLLELNATLVQNIAALRQKEQDLIKNKQTIGFKESEIAKLTQMLLKANTEKDALSQKVVLVQNLLNETNATMQKQKRKIDAYKGEFIVLSNRLTDVNKTVKHQNEKILKLFSALDEKKTAYDDLIRKLQTQKAKIKSLTGIKLKVITALKEELGNKVDIDRQSGSLSLASNILFDKGSAELKEASKTELKDVFEKYVGVLVTRQKIKPYIDKIIVEGHTDSDGDYLYNLDLSQKRALAVMNFLLTLDFAQKHQIQPLMIASGRAYLDAVKVDGVEDKSASRRIEIKFRLKNEDAIHEIETVLDAE